MRPQMHWAEEVQSRRAWAMSMSPNWAPFCLPRRLTRYEQSCYLKFFKLTVRNRELVPMSLNNSVTSTTL